MEIILQPHYICSNYVNACEDKPYRELDPQDFIKDMLADKPLHLQADNYVDNLYQTIANDPNKDQRPTLKFVQITDLHIDLHYVAGASNECSFVICCREINGFPKNKSL